jgi:hypothetical protein
MTSLELLKFYMKPYYQESADETILNHYLSLYTSPACAAYHLWSQKAGELAGGSQIEQSRNGAESITYRKAKDAQEAALRQANYYRELCNQENGAGTTIAASVQSQEVAGIYDTPDGDMYESSSY